ncbi:phosphagen kinase [Myxococcus fulvus]|nr:phosphagen kinase [Myxococcus fulvus]MCK8503751.1 phosphagen kinase [Myxococcus fulvus]
MLARKHLTPRLEARLRACTTRNGWTLKAALRSGAEQPDSRIGIYAGDSESYATFAPLFDPIIQELAEGSSRGHRSDFSLEGLPLEDLDPSGEYVLSTRIRVGRNLARYAFPPAIHAEDRRRLEVEVVEALAGLPDELAGVYRPLGELSDDEREELQARHCLFSSEDRFLESAGALRDWPEARGIFTSASQRLLVWVNEEDALRVISMQPGGDLARAFLRLRGALAYLDDRLEFAWDAERGYHTSCPTNLGTAMRASVHVRLPCLSSAPGFEARCKALGLAVRGLHGEHSEPEDSVYDLSNEHRLGVSERDIYARLHAGVRRLIELEQTLRRTRRQRRRARGG